MTWETNTSILSRLETFSAETAWTSLVEHFRLPLTRYARRAGIPESALPDLVQEALMAFAKRYHSGAFDPKRGRLGAWLFGIARNEVLAQRRKAALNPIGNLDTEQALALPSEEEQQTIWDEEWRRAIFERCIEQVRREVESETWECFSLQVFKGLSGEEVVKRMNVPRTRVYNAKHRIAKRLRDLAREYEDV